jgi:hypothetical protein
MSISFIAVAKLKNNHKKVVCGYQQSSDTASLPLTTLYNIEDAIKDFRYGFKNIAVHILHTDRYANTVFETDLICLDKEDLMVLWDFFKDYYTKQATI